MFAVLIRERHQVPPADERRTCHMVAQRGETLLSGYLSGSSGLVGTTFLFRLISAIVFHPASTPQMLVCYITRIELLCFVSSSNFVSFLVSIEQAIEYSILHPLFA